MTGFTIVNGEFSFTLFIQPSVVSDCSLIFLSSTSNISDTNQARPYLGIASSGDLVAELLPTLVVGTPAVILAGQWNHVAITYSYPNNRISLYHNGLLKITVPGPSPMYNPPVTIPPVYFTLANPIGDPNGSVIQARSFIGAIDEVNIWSRELNAFEVYALANPN